MPSIDSFRKQAKLLQRWHQARDYSVGAKVRILKRFADLSDVEILDMDLPLTMAQEIIAVEAGFSDWSSLKENIEKVSVPEAMAQGEPLFRGVVPILMVRDVSASAAFFETKLGFICDFLHGEPPFYGAVSRGNVCLHLRHVGAPNFAALAARETSLILASIEVTNVKALHAEFAARQVEFAQHLTRHPWGGIDFHIRDPDGNVISFVQYLEPARSQV
ncbi:catechol 2,3-dioxygenase-like lactoylglutathione lyase family enzyme [Rhizomicrobium palustre]|uniref:Catechol 2,3-dioxygenase-like lactoylglutathione lyase family enzyme n=1 Tax=Rhizomicrobium palustre TaxID=189966 RepID=A0A846MY17_9PROT|nr:glyoxalase superfamily protein [Rhizomicrobium palustre]NIK88115.1 catechol 2,3-dioxygenase-like lactoylglutathione lyase family enzyme [Rhizomicrobium palustre]